MLSSLSVMSGSRATMHQTREILVNSALSLWALYEEKFSQGCSIFFVVDRFCLSNIIRSSRVSNGSGRLLHILMIDSFCLPNASNTGQMNHLPESQSKFHVVYRHITSFDIGDPLSLPSSSQHAQASDHLWTSSTSRLRGTGSCDNRSIWHRQDLQCIIEEIQSIGLPSDRCRVHGFTRSRSAPWACRVS